MKRKATWTIVNCPSRWSLYLSLALALCVDHQSWHHSNREMGRALYYMYKCTRDTSAMQGIYKQILEGGSACNGSSVRKHVGREGGAGRSAARSGGCSASTSYQLIPTAAIISTSKRKPQPWIFFFHFMDWVVTTICASVCWILCICVYMFQLFMFAACLGFVLYCILGLYILFFYIIATQGWFFNSHCTVA